METETSLTAQEIQKELDRVIPLDERYKHFLGLNYTHGVKRMAELCQAYWMIDLISGVNMQRQFRLPYQLWELNVCENRGDLTMREDCNSEIMYSQALRYTTFPLAYFKLYVVDGVLMLPGEY